MFRGQKFIWIRKVQKWKVIRWNKNIDLINDLNVIEFCVERIGQSLSR